MAENLPSERLSDDDILNYRARIKEQIQAGMDREMHVLDAARVANVPRNMVLANIGSDPDFIRWWAESKDRPLMVGGDLVKENKPADVVKKDALDTLVACGLFDKLGIVASLANPAVKEDRDELLKLGNLATKLMPTHSHNLSIKATMEELERKKEADIIAEIEKTEAEMREMMEQRGAAERTLEEYGCEDDEPEGDSPS